MDLDESLAERAVAERHERMQKKTELAKRLVDLIMNVRTQLREKLGSNVLGGHSVHIRTDEKRSEGVTAFTSLHALFDHFDVDCDGHIQKNEFFGGLLDCGIEIKPEEFDLVWPIIVESDVDQNPFEDKVLQVDGDKLTMELTDWMRFFKSSMI